MDDMLGMQQGHSRAYLTEVVGSFRLRERVGVLLEILTKVAVEGALHKNIAVEQVLEVPVYFNNVGMVHIELYL